jgi:uncharacterized protein YjiS (DUF1127 family)
MEAFMSRHAQLCDGLPQSSGSTTGFSWTSLWLRLDRILEVRRQRRALLALDDRMLKDIGLSQADAWREANRPLLDLPEYRNRPVRWP